MRPENLTEFSPDQTNSQFHIVRIRQSLKFSKFKTDFYFIEMGFRKTQICHI